MTDAGEGRFTITDPDLARWTNPEAVEPEVLEELVTKGLAYFGDMILTTEPPRP